MASQNQIGYLLVSKEIMQIYAVGTYCFSCNVVQYIVHHCPALKKKVWMSMDNISSP